MKGIGMMMMKRVVLGAIVVAGIVAGAGCKNPQLSGGILHFDQKRYDRARETLLEAVKQEPTNAEARYWLGMSYAELDSTQAARATFEKSIELAGDLQPEVKEKAQRALEHYWSVRHNEGLSYAKAAQEAQGMDKPDEARKNFELALGQFKKARVYVPTKEETPRNMGVIYFNLGHVDSGLVALKDAQGLAAPGDQDAARMLFTQYRELGDRAAEKGMDDPVSLRDAIKFYEEAQTLRPDDADLLFSLGVVEYQLAETDSVNRAAHYQKAAGHFERALTIKPEDQEALFNAATLHLELKTCDEGLTLAKRLLDLNPREGKHHDLVGRLSDCLGQKNERVAGLVFSRALQGEMVPVEGFKESIQAKGAQSDLIRRYREEGSPEEVRTFKDASNREYMAWFYWTRGKALAFYEGEFKYQTTFKPQQASQ
jgi:tetratricopeptide (TPR) repeat protein